MANETIHKYGSPATAISGTANLVANGFVASGEVSSLSSASHARYPLANAVFNGSFSTSLSSASNTIALYRRDLNIDGTSDAPQPQSAAPAYAVQFVGVFVFPPFTAGSQQAVIQLTNIPLTEDCEFYIENRTNATLLSGYTIKITPKTYAPA